jgi:hypothetical protein
MLKSITKTASYAQLLFDQLVPSGRSRRRTGSVELEPSKTTILKRRVGYGEINNTEVNEEEEIRSEKRNKMDVDTTAAVSSGP